MPLVLDMAELRVSFAAASHGSNAVAAQRFDPTLSLIASFSRGTNADQADILYVEERTLTASSTEELDLAGVIADAFGSTITAAELVGIIVLADEDNTNNVEVGGAASNAVPFLKHVSDIEVVKPGGVYVNFAPGAAGLCTVTAGTGDKLKIANSGGSTSVTYRIGLLMRSA